MIKLRPIPLSKAGFSSFGEVIETDGVEGSAINQGFAERFSDLARIDVAAEGGLVNVSIVTANPRSVPVAIKLMERHPLGSQIFYPLQDRPWLVLVCADPRDGASFQAFTATGRQGINYARNIWHHPLLVFDDDSRFFVVDRKGPGNNMEEVGLEMGKELTLTFPARRLRP